ncbi:hypothetical protein RclHR1_04210013 [Rhizophagus clarus]|uniref:Uncharacterized protein n=1 Tax=Rhizophagus clarus TaxID=94130 RepID=A0A2Z6SA35_9GLOM|nr:hypothetical protein RclHR1_04210013 [Rhizophagus clarus]
MLVFCLSVFRPRPIITVQDVKYAKKTARNQLHSGARLLILGNNIILYWHLLTFAQAKNHAIYIQDVVNVDKQDDSTAYRLFHLDVLEQIYQSELENNKMQSLFVYLFVLEDLFDFYLNCNIFYKERIIMAMRGYFFLNIWAEYIESANQLYNSIFFISKNFISPQSFKMFTSLAESLILLIISYRKFYSLYPLYLWKHGIQIQKEKTSASGYVFDFNPNSMLNENINILFIKTLEIKLLNNKIIPHFYISTSCQSMAISDFLKNSDDVFDIDNVSGLDFNNDEFKLDNLNEILLPV